MWEIGATGLEALALTTQLLQRARLAHPTAGLWEAADFQWWWRRPQPADQVEKVFWLDDDGPVAGALVTSWGPDSWQYDPVVVPGTPSPTRSAVWDRALALAAAVTNGTLEIGVADGDREFEDLAGRAGLSPVRHDSTAWLAAERRPVVIPLPKGFSLVDRTQRLDAPHHMRKRNGAEVAERLGQCSLYDPTLDIAIETVDGQVAAYSLYWFDPVTKVGLVEPVRVEDAFQRRGLARAMLSAGLERLAAKGAQRMKVSYGSAPAAALYLGLGFEVESTTTWYADAK
jgi:GNAT superfamily N-acetyltransferase